MDELTGRAAAFPPRALPRRRSLRPGRLRRRSNVVLLGVVLVAGGVIGTLPDASAAVNDTPDETWVANGDVNSVFRAGTRIYLGGSFDQVGPSTG